SQQFLAFHIFQASGHDVSASSVSQVLAECHLVLRWLFARSFHFYAHILPAYDCHDVRRALGPERDAARLAAVGTHNLTRVLPIVENAVQRQPVENRALDVVLRHSILFAATPCTWLRSLVSTSWNLGAPSATRLRSRAFCLASSLMMACGPAPTCVSD